MRTIVRGAVMLGMGLASNLAPNLATGAARPAQPRRLLLPVTDADAERVTGMGCESWFTQRETGYVFVRNATLMLRTAPGRAGLHFCTVADDFGPEDLGAGKPVSCGGRRLTVRRVGRVSTHPEADSADFPATLTIGAGPRKATLRGRFGTAC